MYLAKGLGFVSSSKADIQDLKFDTLEFLRKVEWKAYFKDQLTTVSSTDDIHANLRVSGGKSPNIQHPLMEDVRTKLLGWIANHKPKTPASNVTPLELRGRKWILDKIKDKELFVTKADKGGATLIMNYNEVKEAIEKELHDPNKFEKVSNNGDKHLSELSKKVVSLVKSLGEKEILTPRDKKLICGLNENNNQKLEPEYRAELPYAYPLFKIHKLSEKQIEEKQIPPNRLVHAAKFGPLYRIEKWSSPYFTKISQNYCEKEFLLDTDDLLKQIDEVNNSKRFKDENVHLFTLDVEKLYPSINPEKALEAIHDTLEKDEMTEKRIKEALEIFVKFCFEEAYVQYEEDCYKGKKGIPTGGCNSRQIADIFLHWLLYHKSEIKLSELLEIPFWKRFIDDCFGVWRGTKRQFLNFVKNLNKETNKFGINFPANEIQFGRSVNFLDVTLYLDHENKIQYKSYSKPTDAKRFLNTNSFHPQHVFKSVPISQMIRTANRNSKDDTLDSEMKELKKNFQKSGYKEAILDEIENKMRQRENNNANNGTTQQNTITFPISFFDGLDDFKKLVYELGEDLRSIMGDLRIIFAVRKGKTIGNTVVKNKSMSIGMNNDESDQKCKANGCMQCPLSVSASSLKVNNIKVNIPGNLNCKSSNVIYLWMCSICNNENAYFGRTIQECHNRTSGHRACFNDNNFQKSALSMHAKDKHQNNFSLENFKIAIIKKVSPRKIKREEFRVIDKCRTKSYGMNRYKTLI